MLSALRGVNKSSIFWWVLLWIQGAAAFLAYKAGVFGQIWTGDVTHITIGIIVLHVLTTLKFGVDTFSRSKKHVEYLWTATEAAMTLGMIGTCTGFLIMMTDAFSGGTVMNAQQIQHTLQTMVRGMGTALWTTVVGLVSFLLLKVQFVTLEQASES